MYGLALLLALMPKATLRLWKHTFRTRRAFAWIVFLRDATRRSYTRMRHRRKQQQQPTPACSMSRNKDVIRRSERRRRVNYCPLSWAQNAMQKQHFHTILYVRSYSWSSFSYCSFANALYVCLSLSLCPSFLSFIISVTFHLFLSFSYFIIIIVLYGISLLLSSFTFTSPPISRSDLIISIVSFLFLWFS